MLPVAPERLTVPATFSPSSLDDPIPCALRVLAGAKENRELFVRLPPSPLARLGTMVHDVLRTAGAPVVDAVELLQARLEESPEVIDLPPEAVRSAKRYLAAALEQYRRGAQTPTTVPPLTGRIFGREVWLSSNQLRLAGAADLVRRTRSGGVEIVDYKTGQAVDELGDPLRRYVMQLHAYALLLLERLPGPVQLTLFDGQARTVPGSSEALAATNGLINAFAARFPTGATIVPHGIATPGAACRNCPVRPSCSAYIEAAPGWWHDVPTSVSLLPPDTWGTVVDVVAQGEDTVDLDLLDAAERRVRIMGLRRPPGADIKAGSDLWAFGLIARSVRRGFHGERPHPRWFHEMPTPVSPTRAWSAVVFAA